MKRTHSSIFKTIIVITFMSLAATFTSEAQSSYIGVSTGYNTKNESGSVGVWMNYDVSSVFRIAPNVEYIFRSQHSDAFLINLDFNFPLPLKTSTKIDVYPIAGVTYACWSIHTPMRNSDDVTTRKNRFGLNVGAGVGYRVTDRMKLKLDARYSLVKDFSTTIISLGIGYAF